MRGTVTTVKRDKGFGFLIDEGGQERFFHANGLAVPSTFPQLKEGLTVDFEPYEDRVSRRRQQGDRDNGLRARNIQVVG